ncbi:MAG: DUF2249 domain-containing protein [Betaproteobacteria bacterium]|nr:DUF2249 domain-containing protein [Betaproteobacteria bacterium]
MDREILVDARWLEPPEPMERIQAALVSLRPGQQVRFLIHREPQPLYILLRDSGYAYQTRPLADGCYELLIEAKAERD